MNAYAAVDAAHFAALDRAQAREAALERFQLDWEESITREARLKSFREVDELMDEVMEEIANDPLKNLKFGRALFALWSGWQAGDLELRDLVQDEVNRIIERDFESESH